MNNDNKNRKKYIYISALLLSFLLHFFFSLSGTLTFCKRSTATVAVDYCHCSWLSSEFTGSTREIQAFHRSFHSLAFTIDQEEMRKREREREKSLVWWDIQVWKCGSHMKQMLDHVSGDWVHNLTQVLSFNQVTSYFVTHAGHVPSMMPLEP